MSGNNLLTRIRALDINDAEAVARINVTSYLEADKGCPNPEQTNYNVESHLPHNKHRWTQTLNSLSDADSNNHFLGMEDDAGELKGFVYFGANKRNPDSAEIHALYVHPDEWGKGMGTHLFAQAAEMLKGEGYKRLTVRALGSDPIPSKFYPKMGFELTPLFKKIRGASEVEYEMDLDTFDI